jgi:hypothetical protein
MNSSELFQFSCQCLLLDKNPGFKEGIEEKFISGEVDIDRFVYLCSNHLILPAIYLRFKSAGLIKHFPDEYSNHLKEIYETNKKRNREILLQIDEISNQLEKENIKPVYLKGTANLMDNLYSDSGVRMIGDIDFLVQEKDYLKTAELVMGLGYENQTKMWDDAKTFKHYPRLFRKDVPADVEIHRIPVRKTYTKQFNTELLFQNKKAINNKNNCFVSSNEHKLIHTFIHSQLSNQGYRFKKIGLRDLYDFYLLSQKVNTAEVIATIEEKEKAEVFYNYTQQLMSTGNNSLSSNNKRTKQFIAKHRYFQNHPRQHRYYINTLKLYDLIFIHYILRILKALFQKESFNHIYNRLKDPKWYKKHFKRVRDSF